MEKGTPEESVAGSTSLDGAKLLRHSSCAWIGAAWHVRGDGSEDKSKAHENPRDPFIARGETCQLKPCRLR